MVVVAVVVVVAGVVVAVVVAVAAVISLVAGKANSTLTIPIFAAQVLKAVTIMDAFVWEGWG